MYYPYFRGKQFELIAIREKAELLSDAGFVPIIEPVKETLNGLKRALNAICEANGRAIVIINPHHGDHAEDGSGITTLLNDEFIDDAEITAGILLTNTVTIESALSYYRGHEHHKPTFIHAGFSEAKKLAESLGDALPDTQHVFFEEHCGKLYRKHFKLDGCKRILLRDGFKKQKNADYQELEMFSDLHVTYDEEDMDGFGDFLIVGDDYSEGGGPAYAVAIHLTYIDPDKDDVMFINHFVSTTRDTPTDPAGKFAQALDKLIQKLDSGSSHIIESSAIREFRSLHEHKHFPGLGSVKKLSMIHHIETFANFFAE